MFPLFPWLVYPLVGMAFGYWFKHSDHLKRNFQRTLITGLSLLFIGALITLSNTQFHLADNMRAGPGLIVVIIGFVFIWLSLCHVSIDKIRANRVFDLLYFWSENVTAIYIIHW